MTASASYLDSLGFDRSFHNKIDIVMIEETSVATENESTIKINTLVFDGLSHVANDWSATVDGDTDIGIADDMN